MSQGLEVATLDFFVFVLQSRYSGAFIGSENEQLLSCNGQKSCQQASSRSCLDALPDTKINLTNVLLPQRRLRFTQRVSVCLSVC